MPNVVADGAQLKCTQGTAPAKLVVLPTGKMAVGQHPIATVNDHQGLVNILAFGMCQSIQNPLVQLATMAASGTLTPQPCVPITEAPWTPGAAGMSLGDPTALVLTDDSTCACAYGTVSIVNANNPDMLFGPRANTVAGPANLFDSVPPPPPSAPGLGDKLGKIFGTAGGGTPQNPSNSDVQNQADTDGQRAADKSRMPDSTKTYSGPPVKIPGS